MKRNILFIGLSAALLLLLSACSEEFLKVDPVGRASTENFPESDQEAFQTLIGVYDLMQWNYGRDWNSAFFVKNLPADDVNAGSSESDQLPYQNLDDFAHVSDNPVIAGIWEGFYKAVNASNAIINSTDPSNDFKAQIVAEAKVLRAWNYFELVTLFGDVPFYFENPVSTADFHKPRTPKSDIYAAIEKDLQEVISVLPLKSELPEQEKFRISQGAAQSILGKVYLYQEKWSAAHGVLSDVIDKEGTEFGLEENFGDVWKRVSEYGPESVFEIVYTSQEGYDWGNFGWGGDAEANIHVQLMGPRGNLFENLDAIGMIAGWGFNLPTEKIGLAFETMGDNGPRYQNSLMSEDEFVAAGGSMAASDAHDYGGYLRLKYGTYATQTNTEAIAELNYTTNWRLLRYADVLLMAAEAYNEDGMVSEALTELNKVRVRAELPELSGLSQTQLRQAIKDERQLELAFEGVRYWDLVRWGDAESELSGEGFVSGKHELLPIPQTEVAANNAIEESDQNPGF
ncbi:RagB/SusD family nutrient uptake outer membrane protein [Marinilabilia rubra]|uniref:RagB/SusD family nutrient uptake outer membrane protein n=1 Tax=Marinilabilia rubra TaxID=2162893 RepID=A0A2U2B3M2_9BACT|nr:RagB/SusD family nutrient uptake outer membrane protein [Marinilabilia rubra]PWD97663.1 RagB/SusD family nutrient uptake outer membrane protein [Marinilabilia rubra]